MMVAIAKYLMVYPRYSDAGGDQESIEKFHRVRLIFGVIMGALCLVTAIGNLCVIYIYRKASMLGNLFIISLAIADLVVGSFVMPVATIYAVNEVWTFGNSVCILWLSADYIASTASILNLLALSIDRYMAITSPLQSLSMRTRTFALTMIALAWLISFLWVLPITTWYYFFPEDDHSANTTSLAPQSYLDLNLNNTYLNTSNDAHHQHCTPPYDKSIYFKLATGIFNFYVPLFALISINARIYWTIHKSSRQSQTEDNSGNVKIRRIHRNNKQVKAFRTLVAIVVGFTVCFTPYFTVYIVVALCENCISTELFTVTLWLGYLNSTINPFLYALSNRQSKSNQNSQPHRTASLTRSAMGGSRYSRTPTNQRKSFLMRNNNSSSNNFQSQLSRTDN